MAIESLRLYVVKLAEGSDAGKVVGYASGYPEHIEKVFSKRVSGKVVTGDIQVERVTRLQGQLADLEGTVLSGSSEFEKLFPKWRRVETDEGYDCGRPLYIVGSSGFNFDWEENVAAYDCNHCGGIVLGQPEVISKSIYPSKGSYNCRKCKNSIYEWDEPAGA